MVIPMFSSMYKNRMVGKTLFTFRVTQESYVETRQAFPQSFVFSTFDAMLHLPFFASVPKIFDFNFAHDLMWLIVEQYQDGCSFWIEVEKFHVDYDCVITASCDLIYAKLI